MAATGFCGKKKKNLKKFLKKELEPAQGWHEDYNKKSSDSFIPAVPKLTAKPQDAIIL